MNLKTVISWTYIMKVSKECGQLRLQGRHKEADKKESELKRFALSHDHINIGSGL